MASLARLKDQPPVRLETLDEVDRALAELCRLEAEHSVQEGILQRRLTKVREEMQARVAPLLERRDALVRALTRWVEDHRDLLPPGRRSIQLTHGELGLRKLPGRLKPVAPTRAEAKRVAEEAVERLSEEHPEAVKVERKVDLSALRKLGPEVYRPLGFDLVGAREEPWVRPDRAVVEDLAGKLAPREE